MTYDEDLYLMIKTYRLVIRFRNNELEWIIVSN
jgi:hypothetical protein